MTSNHKVLKAVVISLTFVALLASTALCGDNIDPNNDGSKYAYGENIGWLNFGTRDGNVVVADANLTGYIWAENIGWVNLNPSYGGVLNDGTGFLTGYAWGENIGWINFNPQVPGDPNHYGITVDTEGKFDGWAWGENIGWIHLRATAPVAYGVTTSWTTSLYVDLDDLGRFCDQWLNEGLGLAADLDADEDVDSLDLAVFGEKWFEKCPPGWPLAY